MNQHPSYRAMLSALAIGLVVCATTAEAANPYRPRPRSSPSQAPTPTRGATQRPPAGGPRPQARQPKILFTRETPLGQALGLLRNATKPPLNIVVLWNQIGDNAGIYRDTPIGVELYAGLKVRQYLDLILMGVSAGATEKLGYAVTDGVVLVTTVDALPEKRVTRVYDVTDLLAPPANYGFGMMGFGGMGGMGYGNSMMGGMGMGGYGPQMMGGPGGYGGGYGSGMGYMPGGSGLGYGSGLLGGLGNLYGGGARYGR
jgi:hypothetical protein